MMHRLMFGMLVVFALWPLAHRGLIAQYGLDPWKYGGWAMYVTVARIPEIRAFSREAFTWRAIEDNTGEVAEDARVFATQRKIRGLRYEPVEFARQLFERRPSAAEIKIEVEDYGIDPTTGRVKIDVHSYLYSR